jgi:hypothetical protein
LKEVDLELLVNMVVLKLTIYVNIAMEAPVSIFLDGLVQCCIGHRRALEQLQEPIGGWHNHIVIVSVIVGCYIDLLDPGDFVGSMLLRKACDASIRELLNPVGRLSHPILNGDGKTWASTISIEYVSIGAFFSGECHVVVNKAGMEEFEFFPLIVMLPGPLLVILLVLTLLLLEGIDKAIGDVGHSVKVVSDLEGSLSSVGQVDWSRICWRLNCSGGGQQEGARQYGRQETGDVVPLNGFDLDGRHEFGLDGRHG